MMMLRMMMLRRKKMMMLRRRTDPKTAAHTVREPAQSKGTWRFHKNNSIQKFTGNMPEPRVSPERRNMPEPRVSAEWAQNRTRQCRTMIPASDASNASEMQDNGRQDKARQHRRNTARKSQRSPPWMHRMRRECNTGTDRTAQSKCTWRFPKSHYVEIDRQNARAQKRDPHFVRACAVDMHLEISQEPLYTEIYRKNVRAQSEPKTQRHTLCEPAQSKWRCHKSHFIQKLQEKWPSPEWAQNADTYFVRACAVVDISQEALCIKFTRKMPDPRPAAQTLCEPAVAMHFNMSQEPLHGNLQPQTKSKHGASLRSRNARGDFTRATLSGNL